MKKGSGIEVGKKGIGKQDRKKVKWKQGKKN